MDAKLKKYYRELKKRGLTPEQAEKILAELNDDSRHRIPVRRAAAGETEPPIKDVYDWNDLATLQAIPDPAPPTLCS